MEGSQEEGSARLGRGGNHGGTCHNDKPGRVVMMKGGGVKKATR